jgi:uncharacterized protein with PIN domain
MKIVRGLKAAAKAFVAPPSAQSFTVAGKRVECPHCENVLFRKRKGSVHTAQSSVTNTEWLDVEACVLVCANCSRMVWFFDDLPPDA